MEVRISSLEKTASQKSTNILKGATELPSPLSNLTLKYVALGRGFQNYTCANSSALPVSNGAVATLYDVSSMVSASSSAADKFPAIAVYQPIQPSGASPLTLTAAYQIPAVHEAFPVLGYHYFDSTATPTFNLSSTRSHALLYGKKIADIKAPSTASVGMAGTGAVDWLDLIAKKGSVGLGQVYRVSTAGGNPPGTCAGQDADGSGAGSVVIDYSALYWFYG